MIYSKVIKPFFDWLIALALIVVFSPVWLVGLIIIRIFQGSPVFYLQRRTGYKMKAFTMYKISTLKSSADVDLSLENRDFTRFGKFLRRTGLDEFPQLMNVLKGEMSFVGPRPLPIAYETSYNEKQKDRFRCKPGITGWAQVNGRNAISWNDRFKMDIWYLKYQSFWLDLKIIAHTIVQLLVRESNEIDMPVFTGSNPT